MAHVSPLMPVLSCLPKGSVRGVLGYKGVARFRVCSRLCKCKCLLGGLGLLAWGRRDHIVRGSSFGFSLFRLLAGP